ncbi:hypothetical protein [Terrabacter sp. NPDC080008]|uniref:hypothetical protein n=1 Tax=Terrabacter sp. NPDC080008 TaxID=3155176 RepID=UPI00344B4E13
MRIDEAFRRVIGGYWWLIGLLVLAAAFGASTYASHQDKQYQAVARVQMSGGLASTNVQADAATQWLQGVITSPNLVRAAMKSAGIKGDPMLFATDSVAVNRVGVSTVNDVSVTSGDPQRSVIAANALVQQALRYANTAHQRDAAQMTALNREITSLTKQRDSLIRQLAVAPPGPVLELQARIGAMAPTLTDLLRQRSDLILATSQRSSIGLLDPATAVADPVGPKESQLVGLAALAALILALGLVALLEGVRPRVRGRRWVAAELDAPLLGHLPTPDLASRRGARSVREFGSAAAVLSARFAGRPVLVLPVEKKYEKLAARICSEVETLTGVRLQLASDAAAVRAGSPEGGSQQDAVVIALSPSVEAQRKLEELQRNAEVMGWPVVGVLTFRHHLILDSLFPVEEGRHVGPANAPKPAAAAKAKPATTTVAEPATAKPATAKPATTSAGEPAAAAKPKAPQTAGASVPSSANGGVLSGQKMRRLP